MNLKEPQAMDNEPLTTKVTNINGVYHCQLFRLGELHDEMACQYKEDIRLCFRDMLRWYDKMSFQPFSPMADASRMRGKGCEKPKGKIWQVKKQKNPGFGWP